MCNTQFRVYYILLSSAVPSIYLYVSSVIRRVIQNELLTLTCQTSSAPPTNFKWYKDGLPINYDREVYRVSQKVINRYSPCYYDNSLVFISENAEDMIGEFKCHTSAGRSISIQGIILCYNN